MLAKKEEQKKEIGHLLQNIANFTTFPSMPCAVFVFLSGAHFATRHIKLCTLQNIINKQHRERAIFQRDVMRCLFFI